MQNTVVKIDPNAPFLSESETKEAVRTLNINREYPVLLRNLVDPEITKPVVYNQKIGLFSFVPAKGATPNEKGIYGFAKLRGNFENEDQANERAEMLIREVDSYNKIYHPRVGVPFPVTLSSDFSKDISVVDLKKDQQEAYSENVKKGREKEQKDIVDIQNREKELLEDVKKDKEPTDDRYTTLKVKKAQLTWTFIETEKKMKQMALLIAKTRKEIEELDVECPELKDNYYNKYMDARKKAGLSTSKKDADESFMKYLVEDVHVQALEDAYKELYDLK